MDEFIHGDEGLLAGEALRKAVMDAWVKQIPDRVCRLLEPVPLTQEPRLARRTLTPHKRFTKGSEDIEFITEGLVCHAVLQLEANYQRNTKHSPLALFICQNVVTMFNAPDAYEGLMQPPSKVGEYVIYKQKRTPLTQDMKNK
ncbi:hypothetical protein HK405_007963, partial [Cladochytrium tenue]